MFNTGLWHGAHVYSKLRRIVFPFLSATTLGYRLEHNQHDFAQGDLRKVITNIQGPKSLTIIQTFTSTSTKLLCLNMFFSLPEPFGAHADERDIFKCILGGYCFGD